MANNHQNKFKHFLRCCLPTSLWNTATTQLWSCLIFIILWFDVEWCLATTFTSFSIIETYVNAFLLSLILMSPQMLFGSRRVQAFINLAVAIWFECNLMYQRTYFMAIPLSSYGMVGNLSDFTASVADMLRWSDLGLLAGAIASFIFGFKKSNSTKSVAWKPYLSTMLVVTAISTVLVFQRGGFSKSWQNLSTANFHGCRVPMYTIVGSIANDAINSTKPLTPERKRDVAQWFENHSIAANPDSVGRDNFVLILCESLENWVLNLEVQDKEITPNLNRLLADSSTFFAPHIISQVGAGRSIDGQLLINAGLLPMNTDVYSMGHPNNTYNTLTKAFASQRATKSHLLTVDKPSVWNQEAVANSFGFDTIIARDSWVIDEMAGGARRKLGDRSFARQIVARMNEGEIWNDGSNAFIQIVTYSGHNPFYLPDELDELKLDRSTLPTTVANYLTTAHYTDAAIGTLVDYISSRPDYDRTMIVITGDHEGLASERADLHNACPFVNPRPEVPFIVVNSPQGGKYDAIAGQIDIHPTILDLAGIRGENNWRGLGCSMISHKHPGIAIGSLGEIFGDTTNVDSSTLNSLTTARNISDCIITYNLLSK